MDAEKELFGLGFLTRLPTAQEQLKIGAIDDADEWAFSLKKIQRCFPELISREGCNFIDEDKKAENEMWSEIEAANEQSRKMGKYAPMIFVDGAESRKGQIGTATEKQIAYLRLLGVRDQEILLASITKQEASDLIKDVLSLREKNGLPI